MIPLTDYRHEPPPFELYEQAVVTGTTLKLNHPGAAHFFFLLDGSISRVSPGSSTPQGPLVFFPAGAEFELNFAEPATCFVVRVNPSLLGRFRIDWREYREPVSLQDWEANWLIKRLQSEFTNRHRAREVAMEAIVLQLLALSSRNSTQLQRHGESFWLKKVRARLDSQYLSEHRLCDLATFAGVHRVHLVREFRKHYGVTIGQHIRKRRVAHACELLARTDLLLREIATECRFVDQSHFSRQFKKLSGLTPAEYRDLVRSV